MKKIIALVLACSAFMLTGCAHQIQLNPELSNLPESTNKIDKNVGYVLNDTLRMKEVTTPGGGGDKVTYTPYKDTETALYTVLANKFNKVFMMNSASDTATIESNNISYVFIPEIVTNSSSSSMLTWPPTKFMVNLSCKAIDAEGNQIWEKTVSTEGEAEFDEFKSDFSLSARRATKAAFEKMAQELDATEAFK